MCGAEQSFMRRPDNDIIIHSISSGEKQKGSYKCALKLYGAANALFLSKTLNSLLLCARWWSWSERKNYNNNNNAEGRNEAARSCS
jgi:hypothetical protein